MNSYRPADVTAKAKEIARQVPTAMEGSGLAFGTVAPRIPVLKSIDASYEGREKVKVFRKEQIAIGSVELDLNFVNQLIEQSQTRCIAHVILYAKELTGSMAEDPTLSELLDMLESAMDSNGLDICKQNWYLGDLARPRRFEIAQALNRLRGLAFVQRR